MWDWPVAWVLVGVAIGAAASSMYWGRENLRICRRWGKANQEWLVETMRINGQWYSYCQKLEAQIRQLKTEGDEWKQLEDIE